ncbi:UbiA family prenyltransferase [Sediminitomix flava]|uniref:1,4-dihydroxy-2-naphthoate octaprenyltransferase n=1 Tax=Sediminitomix flava TaxID=379075 RepID=A0A315Z0P1_SEDFL|nr:UbiA family prenyltransferase [Sediminitomix flava]PWJ36081.1 1,4-dihydroxy-2-naphthoate octaprenyltransferase [Sediminitomix flava]
MQKVSQANIKSTLVHLRIPFSIWLMPIFLFAVGNLDDLDLFKVGIIFLVWHLFVYPASNAYNSFYDKDEGSIGGIEAPPPVHTSLLYTSLVMDLIALVLSWFFIGTPFMLGVLIYGLVSKAYSHPSIRLKKLPLLSWFVVANFQGAWVYLCTILALANIEISELLQDKYLFPAFLCTLMLFANYPLTQIYQHEEDKQRGDMTMSRLLGIKGTLFFSAGIFLVTGIGFIFYYWQNNLNLHILFYLLCTQPILIYFTYWSRKVFKDLDFANYKYTMRMNIIASFCMNLFFFISLILD